MKLLSQGKVEFLLDAGSNVSLQETLRRTEEHTIISADISGKVQLSFTWADLATILKTNYSFKLDYQ
jgi:hypothetical protein